MDNLLNVVVAVCGVGVIILLLGFMAWYGVFGKMQRRILMLFMGTLVGTAEKDDSYVEKPFVPGEQPEHLSDIMESRAQSLDFDAAVQRHRDTEHGVPAVADPLSENLSVQSAEAEVDEVSRRSSALQRVTRPFRFTRLRPGDDK